MNTVSAEQQTMPIYCTLG